MAYDQMSMEDLKEILATIRQEIEDAIGIVEAIRREHLNQELETLF